MLQGASGTGLGPVFRGLVRAWLGSSTVLFFTVKASRWSSRGWWFRFFVFLISRLALDLQFVFSRK